MSAPSCEVVAREAGDEVLVTTADEVTTSASPPRTRGRGHLSARPMPADAVVAHLLGRGADQGAQNPRERTSTA